METLWDQMEAYKTEMAFKHYVTREEYLTASLLVDALDALMLQTNATNPWP